MFNPENFSQLKLINCCYNNFNRSYFSDIKDILGLESANGFLMDPKLSQNYYLNLQKKLTDQDSYPMKFLCINYIPTVSSKPYLEKLKINENIIINLKKLDLSFNGITCDTFFTFVGHNKGCLNLRSLKLNGNLIDDTFFEKYLKLNIFTKLKALSLDSNRIGGDCDIEYKDDLPIKEKCNPKIVYKLRLMYKFIEANRNLTKLSITKNPISEMYTIIQEKKNDADKSNAYIERDKNGSIIINGLFSFLVKIRDEVLVKEEEKTGRNIFNVRFDCRSNVNRNSDSYPYSSKPIIYKNLG